MADDGLTVTPERRAELIEQQRAEIADAFGIPESLREAWRQIDEEA